MSDSDEDHGFEASCEESYEVDVILLNGIAKENYPVFLGNTVLAEKTRIWKKEQQEGPPELNQVVLVLIGPHGEQTMMDDDKNVEDYLSDFANSSIKFMLRSKA